MKAFVVNLARRTDRRAHMMRALPSSWDVEYTSDWDGPFDGAELDLANLPEPFSTYPDWKLPFPSDHRYWDRDLLAGEVGCTLSHLHVWQRVAECEHVCAVLEDDVTFAPDAEAMVGALASKMTASEGPALCYLGRSSHGPEPQPVDGLVQQPGYTYGSFAYLLRPDAAATFVNSALAQYIIPADEFLPAMYMDHPRPDIRMIFPKSVSAAAVVPSIVTTDSSMGSDSERVGDADSR